MSESKSIWRTYLRVPRGDAEERVYYGISIDRRQRDDTQFYRVMYCVLDSKANLMDAIVREFSQEADMIDSVKKTVAKVWGPKSTTEKLLAFTEWGDETDNIPRTEDGDLDELVTIDNDKALKYRPIAIKTDVKKALLEKSDQVSTEIIEQIETAYEFVVGNQLDTVIGALEQGKEKFETTISGNPQYMRSLDGVKDITPKVSQTRYPRPNGTVYYARPFAGRQDVEILRQARELGKPTLLYGPPGAGKTALLEAAFCREDADSSSPGLWMVNGTSSTEASDFEGRWLPAGEPGHFKWVDGPLTMAMKRGEVLFVDDITLISPRALAKLYSAMDDRRMITLDESPAEGNEQEQRMVVAKEGFYVVAAYNPDAPGGILSEALNSRFHVKIRHTTDYDVLSKNLGVPPKAVAFAKKLIRLQAKEQIEWVPQARELLTYRDLMPLGEDFALRNLLENFPLDDRPEAFKIAKTVWSTSKWIRSIGDREPNPQTIGLSLGGSFEDENG